MWEANESLIIYVIVLCVCVCVFLITHTCLCIELVVQIFLTKKAQQQDACA